jgi:hypothetical protein
MTTTMTTMMKPSCRLRFHFPPHVHRHTLVVVVVADDLSHLHYHRCGVDIVVFVFGEVPV